MTTMTPRMKLRKPKKCWTYFFIILPLMALVFMFSYVPLLGWYLSFIEYKVGQPILSSPFVGLKFFRMLLEGRDFSRIMKNTCLFSLYYMFMLVLPPLFAILLNELKGRRFGKFCQTAATLPNFVSWVLVYSVFYAVFTTDGVVNVVLSLFGGKQSWLSSKRDVYWFQSFVWAWKNVGWKSIIYIAAIAGIDQTLYEAAAVDGATRFRQTLHITIPGLIPTFMVMFLLAIGSFVKNGLEQYMVFDNAIIHKQIETLELYTYNQGLKLLDYSYATAVGMFQSVISIVLLFAANRLSKAVRGESII